MAMRAATKAINELQLFVLTPDSAASVVFLKQFRCRDPDRLLR